MKKIVLGLMCLVSFGFSQSNNYDNKSIYQDTYVNQTVKKIESSLSGKLPMKTDDGIELTHVVGINTMIKMLFTVSDLQSVLFEEMNINDVKKNYANYDINYSCNHPDLLKPFKMGMIKVVEYVSEDGIFLFSYEINKNICSKLWKEITND